VTIVTTSPRYFQTIGIPIARGRGFNAADGTAGHDAIIVNQRFVAIHFANEDPIGRRVRLTVDGPTGPNALPPVWAAVVGVVPNVRQGNLQEVLPDPVAYLPLRQNSPTFAFLLLRASGDPAALIPAVRDQVRAVDADLPLFRIQTMDQGLAQQRWPFQIFGTMFAVFATIALALSAVGLYAVTAYSVAQRTQEIGVRMALGAQAPQVWWLILRRGLIQLAIGLAIGLAGAFGVGTLLKSILLQSNGRDAGTLAAIVAVLIVVSVAASFGPARRATRLDPVSALRND
jgi:putative ABC transport system permease protein